MEVNKNNILNKLLNLSNRFDFLCFYDSDLSDDMLNTQTETLNQFNILCNRWTLNLLDELIIEDYNKAINIINVFVKRLVIAINSNGYREESTDIGKQFIPRGKMFVLELCYAYPLNEDYISQIFTKPELEEFKEKKNKPLAKSVWNNQTRYDLIDQLGIVKNIQKVFTKKQDQNFIISQILGLHIDNARTLINGNYKGQIIDNENLECSQWIQKFKTNNPN